MKTAKQKSTTPELLPRHQRGQNSQTPNPLSRRNFLKTGTVGMLGVLSGLAFAEKKEIPLTPPASAGSETFKGEARRMPGGMPNVLLILADDQGMHMSCINTPGISTPNMDAMAKSGVLFLNAHSSCASCSPSRSSILTGMYPHSNGHWRNTVTPVIDAPEKEFGHESSKLDAVGVHENIPTLTEILNKKGYFTGITRKWHLSPHWKFPFHKRIQCDHTSWQTKEKCAEFFKEAGNKPFFLNLNITNTHRPFKLHVFNKKLRVPPEDVHVPPQLADTPLMRKDLSDYYSTVQCLDKTVGTTMEALRESGKLDNTIVIFTSDHGWAYHRAKATVYDAGTHVPLIISGPGIKQGKVVKDGVSLIDLMPTILDYAKIKIPKNVQGKSLLPLLEGKSGAKGRDFVFTEHHAHGPGRFYPSRSVTDGRIHYIINLMPELKYTPPQDLVKVKLWGTHSYEATVKAKDEFPVQYELLERTMKRPPEELYDLHNDPGEINNLINDPRYAVFLKKMRDAMKKWRKETKDTIDDPRKIIRNP
ncbi:sulfatase [bacterium]|nr:sulfatase [bacterium]